MGKDEGNTEVCDDVDNDCDGVIDPEASADAPTWYADDDDDGYGDPEASQVVCDQPTGYLSDRADCDDDDAGVNPAATDVPFNGVDEDCDGADGNEIDLLGADAKFIGEDDDDYAGRAVSDAGDVDGDGYDDLLVGAYGESSGGTEAGAAYLVLGPATGKIDLSNAVKFIGEAADDYAGIAVSGAGDVNGDGYDDVLIGADGEDSAAGDAGAAYLVLGGSGALTGEIALSDADAKFAGEAVADAAGWAVSGAGDVDGDDFGDLLVSAIFEDAGGSNAGSVYLVMGPVSGDVDLSGAGAKLIGEAVDDYAGHSVSGAGDVDGDGYGDLIVGARNESSGGADAGAAYLLLGGATGGAAVGRVDLSSADAKLIGEARDDHAGCSVSGAGDVDDDGYDDVLIGAREESAGGPGAGAAYLLLGPVTGEIDLSDADAKLVGESDFDLVGDSVSGAGDVDADGYGDLIVGSYGNSAGGTDAGAAYLLLGPVTGELDLASAHVKFVGESTRDSAGAAVSGAGDVDGDGRDELLIGAYREDTGGSYAGAAYLVVPPL